MIFRMLFSYLFLLVVSTSLDAGLCVESVGLAPASAHISTFAISPDQKWCVVGTNRGKVIVHNAATGSYETELVQFDAAIDSITFSSDGRYLIAGSKSMRGMGFNPEHDYALTIWRRTGSEFQIVFTLPRPSRSGVKNCLEPFSDDMRAVSLVRRRGPRGLTARMRRLNLGRHGRTNFSQRLCIHHVALSSENNTVAVTLSCGFTACFDISVRDASWDDAVVIPQFGNVKGSTWISSASGMSCLATYTQDSITFRDEDHNMVKRVAFPDGHVVKSLIYKGNNRFLGCQGLSATRYFIDNDEKPASASLQCNAIQPPSFQDQNWLGASIQELCNDRLATLTISDYFSMKKKTTVVLDESTSSWGCCAAGFLATSNVAIFQDSKGFFTSYFIACVGGGGDAAYELIMLRDVPSLRERMALREGRRVAHVLAPAYTLYYDDRDQLAIK